LGAFGEIINHIDGIKNKMKIMVGSLLILMTLPMGNVYEGEYRNGLPHGKGTYVLADGRKYVGDWKDGHPDGYGLENQPSGAGYDGQWRAGLPHGRGIATQNGQVAKDGYWLAGEFVGQDKPKELN
jgi:hypothetical protein